MKICAAFTLFIAVSFPFFGDILGLFGGFGFASTSYIVSQLNSIFINFIFFFFVINFNFWGSRSCPARFG